MVSRARVLSLIILFHHWEKSSLYKDIKIKLVERKNGCRVCHGFWKHHLDYVLSNKGGLFFLGCNYAVCQTNILLTFYHELFS